MTIAEEQISQLHILMKMSIRSLVVFQKVQPLFKQNSEPEKQEVLNKYFILLEIMYNCPSSDLMVIYSFLGNSPASEF